MEKQRCEAAAVYLASHRNSATPITEFAPDTRPGSEPDGYAVQAALHARFAAQAQGPRVGWKIGCTTQTMQDMLGIDQPAAGGICAKMVQDSPGRFAGRSLLKPGVECEIAVGMGATLSPQDSPYDRDSVTPAVQWLAPAIELVDNRYADFSQMSVPSLIADDFFQAGAVIGPRRTDWRDLDLPALRGEMWVDGTLVGSGIGADVLGHPLDALAWLANHLSARGEALREGDMVLLGSLVQTAWISTGAQAEIQIEALGKAALTIT